MTQESLSANHFLPTEEVYQAVLCFGAAEIKSLVHFEILKSKIYDCPVLSY